MDLDQKVAIVTGASSGIGRAIVRALFGRGCKVVACWGTASEKVEKVLDELDSDRERSIDFGGDLSVQANVEELFKNAIETFDRVDILINCAGGVVEGGELPETTKQHWYSVLDANLISAVLCTQQAVKVMPKGGKIVNIGSVLGDRYGGREGIVAYSTAKAAVHSFTQTAAKQLVPDILVNAVSPGRTITEAYDVNTPEENEVLGSANKIDRWIQPEEIADAVIFACVNDALVGEIISVDAGFFF